MGKRNPSNNSVLQALLDIADRGMGEWKVSDLITRIHSDSKLQADLQAAWNRHSYPEKNLVYAQLGIDQRLFTLSDSSYKIISFLGLYCHQSGLIQVKLDDICSIVGIGRTSAKRSIAELRECGALNIEAPAARHEAPVYRINPALINKGTRRKSDVADFTSSIEIKPDQYIFNREPELVVQTDLIRTSEMVFNKLHLVPAEKAKPVKKRPSNKKSPEIVQIPGQMDIFDFIKEGEK